MVGLGGHVLGPGGDGVVGVDKVDGGLRTEPREERRGPLDPQRVPAHVGNFQPRRRRKPDHAAGEQTEAWMLAVLLADLEQELQTEANPQARLARPHSLAKRFAQPRPLELGRGVGKRSDSR